MIEDLEIRKNKATSRDKYYDYLPLVQQMIKSFKIMDVGLEPYNPNSFDRSNAPSH